MITSTASQEGDEDYAEGAGGDGQELQAATASGGAVHLLGSDSERKVTKKAADIAGGRDYETLAGTVLRRAVVAAHEESIAAHLNLKRSDNDFAAETANMTRAQILGQAATQALAMANNQPSSVLALLG